MAVSVCCSMFLIHPLMFYIMFTVRGRMSFACRLPYIFLAEYRISFWPNTAYLSGRIPHIFLAEYRISFWPNTGYLSGRIPDIGDIQQITGVGSVGTKAKNKSAIPAWPDIRLARYPAYLCPAGHPVFRISGLLSGHP